MNQTKKPEYAAVTDVSDVTDIAIHHDPAAVEMHRVNHPGVERVHHACPDDAPIVSLASVEFPAGLSESTKVRIRRGFSRFLRETGGEFVLGGERFRVARLVLDGEEIWPGSGSTSRGLRKTSRLRGLLAAQGFLAGDDGQEGES